MTDVARRRWVPVTALTLHLAACGVIGYFAEWRQPDGDLRWTWTLTYMGIPLGCLFVGLLQRRARWTIACAFVAPLVWLVGYALRWEGDPRRDIFVAVGVVAVAVPTIFLSAVAGIVAIAIVGPADVPMSKSAYPRCVGCGYNLTGNVSGRCPECGSHIER
jgi:uncharacterized membrane protein YbjE (DUF340 family)